MALILGATMRVTRAVVLDDIGKWWVKAPIDSAIKNALDERLNREAFNGDSMNPWWLKYRAALDCPFCIGFHLGWLVLASYLVARRIHMLGPWRFVAGALTLNQVSAHLAIRLGDVDREE